MSRSLPKLEKASSGGLRIGLRCLLVGPSGDAGLGKESRVAVSGTGDEWARVICGARRREPEDLERAWPMANGERGRGRNGNATFGMPEVEEMAAVDSGAVARRGLSGLIIGDEVGGLFSSASAGGRGRGLLAITGGSDILGTMPGVCQDIARSEDICTSILLGS